MSGVQAIPAALAGIMDAGDYSPTAAVNLLLSALQQGLPSGGSLYDEDACTARCLAALGMLRPREASVSPPRCHGDVAAQRRTDPAPAVWDAL